MLQRRLGGLQTAGDSGTRFVGTVVFALTVGARYVAEWGNSQMHPTVFMSISPKAGVTVHDPLFITRHSFLTHLKLHGFNKRTFKCRVSRKLY
jgi:hypothetical protein